VITPYGVALDSSGNIYIADQGRVNASCNSGHGPAILVFPPYNKKIPYTKPIRKIHGCATMLHLPTDVKVNSDGVIYVADTTTNGSGIILIFPSGANGEPTPSATYKSPGVVTGIGIVP
jgi:hypothetical protein